MNVGELIKKKHELEDNISDFLVERMNEFRKETGISIKAVNISFYENLTLGSKDAEYVITSTDVILNI
jgi:hypothetical protein